MSHGLVFDVMVFMLGFLFSQSIVLYKLEDKVDKLLQKLEAKENG